MTQSAGIQLQVGLDLAFFRQQLTTLGTTAAGYKLPINIKFDRLSVQNELNALGRNISQRTYRLEVATNLATEIKNAGTLAKALRGLDNAVQKNKGIANRVAGGPTGGATVDASNIQTLVNKARKPALQALYSEMSKASIPMAAVGKDTVNNLRNAILSGVPQLTTDLARGIASGISPGMKESGSKGAKLFIDAWKDAAGIASPSKVFKALGEFSADGLEIGFLNGLKDFKTKAVAEIKSIVKSLQQEARVGMIATGGLLSPVTGPRTAATRTIPGVPSPRNAVSNQDPGRSNNRILNSLSLLTGDPKLYRSRMANLGASRLPSSLLGSAATQMNLESMAPSFKQSRLGGTKTGVANIIDEAFFGRGTLPKASSALNGLSNTIERLASTARAAAPSGILQSASGNPRFRAFGGVPSSQSMGIFPPTAQPTAYPPSGGFLEFSRRATAISAGLPGNVFGGRQPPGGPPGGPPRGGRGFPSDGMMGGRQAPATFIGAGSQMEKFKAALDVASVSTQNFRASQLPLIGGIKSLAGEFGEATKQVLLYGTAYKGLAFLTSLPGQVLNAAKSQQQFNNGLKVATQETGTFAKELLFVDNVQRAFGLNLETTRTGFTRLYASMAPTGFDSGSIEKLFTGISAATASLQLTPDKAERVIYAFGQMASKGQIMAEELKGQLGDVLPGALAIFSKAAGMSVKEFSKAMEDGEFTGNRFREVFAKVSDELINRFGTGAQVAGKSLQGLINVVGGDFQRTLESFAPLANSAAQSVLGPLGGALNQLAKAAQIATGETGRLEKQISQAQKDVADLKLVPDVKPEQIQAAEKNVLALKTRQEELNEAYKDPAIKSQVEGIQSFVSELGRVGNFVTNLASILQSTLGPAFGILGNNLTTVLNSLISLAVGFAAAKLVALAVMGTLNTMNAVVQAGGTISTLAAAKHAILAAAFRLIGIQATGAQLATMGFGVAVKGLLASTGIGLLVVALTSAATAFMTLGDKAAEAARKSKQSIDSMTQAAASGNVALIDMEIATARAEISDLDRAEKMIAGLKTRKGARGATLVQKENVTPGMRAFLEQQGFTVPTTGSFSPSELTQQIPSLRSAAQQKLSGGQLKRPLAVQRQEALGINVPTPGTLPPESAEEDSRVKAAADKAAQDRLRIEAEEQRRRIEAANHDNALMQINFQKDLQLTDAGFEHKKNMIDALHDYEMSGLNDMEARQKKFEKDLQDVQLQRVNAVRQALQKVVEAQVATQAAANVASVAGAPAAPTLPAPAGAGPSFRVGQSFQGFRVSDVPGSSRAYRGGTHEGYDVETPIGTALSYAIGGVVKSIDRVGKGNAGKTLEVQLDNGIVGMSMHLNEVLVEAGQRFQSGQLLARTGATGAGTGPHLHQESAAHGYKAGRAGDSMAFLQLGKGGGASRSSTVNTMARRETTEARDVETAQARQSAALSIAELDIQNKLALAYQQTATIIKQNIDSIYPIEKIKLENKLSQIRHDLQMQNMPEEMIAYEERRAAAVEEGAMAEEVMKKKLQEAKTNLTEYTEAKKKSGDTSKEVQGKITLLTAEVKLYEDSIASLPAKQKELNIAMLEGAIAALKNADALKAQQETMGLIKSSVESATSSYKGFMKEVITGGDPTEALKKFQEALTDQVVTIFLDFAMKPVEDMLKNQLSALFGIKTEEQAREEAVKKMEEQLNELKESRKLQVNIDKNVQAIANGGGGAGQNQAADTASAVKNIGLSSGIDTSLNGLGGEATAGFDAASVFSNPEALTSAFANIQSSIGTSMEGITSSFQAGADSLANTLPSWSDALTTKLPAALTTSTNNTKGEIPKWQESLGKVTQGIGIAAGAIMGIAAGIGQIKEGGTSNVLGGIGSIFMSLGGAVGGFANFFKGANGGVAGGGWKPFPVTAFANGGMVNGPTLGLVGEGKYNEAIVPLPDGKSIPVQMRGGGGGGLREAMSGSNGRAGGSPILNMSFQSTNINGVEYVSRDQLEQAMAATRRQAASDGANRGMSMTLDKLQQSPSTRSRLGIGGR